MESKPTEPDHLRCTSRFPRRIRVDHCEHVAKLLLATLR